MATSEIMDLAVIIATNTAKVHEYLSANNLPHPSFNPDAPKKYMIPPTERHIEDAREAVIDATSKLRTLMLGPTDYVLEQTPDQLLSLHAIYRFKLASSFPIYEEATFEQIATSCGLDEVVARRILRHAMTKHIFREPRKGIVSHTALSRLLAEDSRIHEWIGAATDDIWPATTQTINALVKYPGSQEPNETGFAIANNTQSSIYQVLAEDPYRAMRFGESMKVYTEGTGYDLKHLVDNYPWSSIGEGTVVDIGGSNGFVSVRLAESFPSLRCIVQDFPSMIVSGAEHLPAELADRVTFTPHDFLTQQPVKNADVYFFRWVLHGWSDKYCVQILQNLIPALKPGARVVINDNVLPEPGVLSSWPEERMRSVDLIQMVIQNSRERELEDWAKLFQLADSRFKFKGGRQPTGSALWILEAIWLDE